MKYLPWKILDTDPGIIVDSAGCAVVNLNTWGAVGKGHDPLEIVQLIVKQANEGLDDKPDTDLQAQRYSI